jgi:hypothetical protein
VGLQERKITSQGCAQLTNDSPSLQTDAMVSLSHRPQGWRTAQGGQEPRQWGLLQGGRVSWGHLPDNLSH